MLEFVASALALVLAQAPQKTPEQAAAQAVELIQPLPSDKVDAIRAVCALPADAKFIDGRHIASADALATMLEGLELDTPSGPRTIITGAKFVGEDITVMLEKLAGGCIHESDLSGTRAEAASFAGSSMINSSIEGADWSSAILNETRLIGVNAKDANLAGASLRSALWKGQNFNSNLAKTNFAGALMLGFRFECGITMDESCGGSSGAKFDRADLSAADLAEFPTWGYDSFDKSNFDNTRIHPRALVSMPRMEIGGPIVLASAGRRWDEDQSKDTGVTISPAQFAQLRDDALFMSNGKPSFDCAKASIAAEEIICGEYASELRSLDRDMAKAYAQYREHRRGTARALEIAGETGRETSAISPQANWLRLRNRCDDHACIKQSYEDRISVLISDIGTELNLAPDQSVGFHEDVLPLSADMRKTELYKRILPVLEGASMQDVTLTGLEDGSIRIEGTAVGGNAHLCSVEADAFYDAKTGWYSVRSLVNDKPMIVPLFRVWEDRLQFKYSGNMGDTPREAGSFISCGARAGFDELRALSGV